MFLFLFLVFLVFGLDVWVSEIFRVRRGVFCLNLEFEYFFVCCYWWEKGLEGFF